MDRDLGEMLHALTRAVIAAEEPVLAAHGLTMWEYAVLRRLGTGAAPTQARLAATVRRDKTRIIPLLDGLEARDLLRRTPDPVDRRNKVVELTPAGRALVEVVVAAIRGMEDELLGGGLATLRTVLARAADELEV